LAPGELLRLGLQARLAAAANALDLGIQQPVFLLRRRVDIGVIGVTPIACERSSATMTAEGVMKRASTGAVVVIAKPGLPRPEQGAGIALASCRG
jgi:hypothetical protein